MGFSSDEMLMIVTDRFHIRRPLPPDCLSIFLKDLSHPSKKEEGAGLLSRSVDLSHTI
jgi:hypothetical protein